MSEEYKLGNKYKYWQVYIHMLSRWHINFS